MARDVAQAGTAGRIAALRLRGSAGWLPAIRAWFVAGLALEAEQRRLFPWLAVAFGLGILVYFTATAGERRPCGRSSASPACSVPCCRSAMHARWHAPSCSEG